MLLEAPDDRDASDDAERDVKQRRRDEVAEQDEAEAEARPPRRRQER